MKEAEHHNALLDKFLQAKQAIARANAGRNAKALIEAKVKLESSSRNCLNFIIGKQCYMCHQIIKEQHVI